MTIIGLIFIASIIYLDRHQKISRDKKRIGDIQKIQIALDKYYEKHGQYPDSPADGPCDKWDVGFWQKDKSDSFLQPLITEKYLTEPLGDPIFYANCKKGYFYHRYPCNNNSPQYPCYSCEKPFYILGIKKLETQKIPQISKTKDGTIRTNGSMINSRANFKCPFRNWQEEFDYVVGKLED